MTSTITIDVFGEQDAKCQTVGCDRVATVLQVYVNKVEWAEPWAEWVCEQDAQRYAHVSEWPSTDFRVVGELQSQAAMVGAR